MKRDSIDIGIALLLMLAVVGSVWRAIVVDPEVEQLLALSWGILAAIGLVLLATVRR